MFLLNPGNATSEEISELFYEISKLYRLIGGKGIEFSVTGTINMPSRRRMRQLVSDYILNHLETCPEETHDECELAISNQLKEDFGDSPWLEILLLLLKILLPLLFSLKKFAPEKRTN